MLWGVLPPPGLHQPPATLTGGQVAGGGVGRMTGGWVWLAGGPHGGIHLRTTVKRHVLVVIVTASIIYNRHNRHLACSDLVTSGRGRAP